MGDTRARILAAARAQFAHKGLEQTTWREIARAAEVDPALVLHYFESKETLFFEAIREIIIHQMETVFSNTRGTQPIGDQLVSAILDLWDSPDRREALVALVRAGVSNDRVAGLIRGLFESDIPSRVGARLVADRIEQRVALVATQIIGLVLARYVVGLPSIATASRETLVSLVGPTITRYLTAAATARGFS
jgi:AcrR family transcriptional regulator